VIDRFCSDGTFALITDLFFKEVCLDRVLPVVLTDLMKDPEPSLRTAAFLSAVNTLNSKQFAPETEPEVYTESLAKLRAFVDDWVQAHGMPEGVEKVVSQIISFDPQNATDVTVTAWSDAVKFISSLPRKEPFYKSLHTQVSNSPKVSVGTHLRKYFRPEKGLGSTSRCAGGAFERPFGTITVQLCIPAIRTLLHWVWHLACHVQ
jgi:hypothetical protein